MHPAGASGILFRALIRSSSADCRDGKDPSASLGAVPTQSRLVPRKRKMNGSGNGMVFAGFIRKQGRFFFEQGERNSPSLACAFENRHKPLSRRGHGFKDKKEFITLRAGEAAFPPNAINVGSMPWGGHA